MSVVVRRAMAGDEPRLSLIARSTFLETFADIIHGDDILEHCRTTYGAAAFGAALTDGAAALWLAETGRGSVPIGFAHLATPELPLPDLSAEDLELKRIYVLQRFHGDGTGAKLMEAAVAVARDRGAGRLLLGVYAHNHRAIAFYTRMGFAKSGDRQFQVGANTYEDVMLELDLRDRAR